MPGRFTTYGNTLTNVSPIRLRRHPRRREAVRLQPAADEREIRLGIEIARVGAGRPERVGFDDVEPLRCPPEKRAAVAEQMLHARIAQERVQPPVGITSSECVQRCDLRPDDLDADDVLGFRPACRGVDGVPGSQADDRDIARVLVDERRQRPERGVNVSVGQDALPHPVHEDRSAASPDRRCRT